MGSKAERRDCDPLARRIDSDSVRRFCPTSMTLVYAGSARNGCMGEWTVELADCQLVANHLLATSRRSARSRFRSIGRLTAPLI